MVKRNLAVLAGNGLSIAFNNALNLAAITQDLIDQLKSASDNGDKVVHAMNEIARRAEGEAEVTSEDFEKLVGAFDSQAITLNELSLLAALVESDDKRLLESIGEVAAFSQRVRDMGISYVLKTIMERSVADHERDQGLHQLFRVILDSFQGQVYFGNLNYDTLLMSALMAIEAPMCDMAYGAISMGIRVMNEDDADAGAKPVEIAKYTARHLRTALNFPTGDKYRVKLLHMHGSLAYWESTTSDVRVKVPIEALRLHDLWEGLRTSSPGWRPSVVLANSLDKTKHVQSPPFDVAYEAFRVGLAEAEHWLIIGYSFRDQCVNEELRKEFSRRSRKPAVLVCTYGDDLKLEDIHRAFGWGAEDGTSWGWLHVNREGAVGLEASFEWGMFTYESEA